MPYETRLINGGTGIYRVGSGVVTGREMIEAARALKVSAEAKRITHSFIDVTEATEFDVSANNILELAKLANAFAAVVPVMIIALISPSDLGFGMFRTFESMADLPGWKIIVFRTREDGWAWLESEQAAKA